MIIFIHVPIGIWRTAATRGTFWKIISCADCQQGYAYKLELEATGEDIDLFFLDAEGSAERARANAEQNLIKKGHNVVLAVPCPNCGHYQNDMARMLKDEASINRIQITGAVMTVLSLISFAFGIPHYWIFTTALGAAGLTVLAYGYVVAFRFDANASDREARKELGRQHAVWGKQLADMIATSSVPPPTDRNGHSV